MNRANNVVRESVVLVMVAWGNEPLFARTVRRGESLWLGDRPEDLPLPAFAAFGGQRAPLVAFDRVGPVLSVPAGAEASLDGETLRVKFGDFSLTLTRVEISRAERPRLRAATEPVCWAAAVAFLVLSTLAVMAKSLPSLGSTDVADIERPFSIDAPRWAGGRAEPNTADSRLYLSRTPTHYLIPINGITRCGSDVMGSPEAVAETGRYAIEGPYENADPHLASNRGGTPPATALERKAARKIAGGNPRAPTMPWGRETASGRDEESARGKMWGDPIEDASGNDGFGLPRVEGGIAKGLHWASAGSSEAPSRVLHTGLRIQGPLRPSVVTGAVASRFDRFHACYDRAREKSPELAGKVELSFAVGPDGRVSEASAKGSQIVDQELTSCLAASISDLTLPSPETRASSVTYPLFFEPGTGKSAPLRLARRDPPRDLPRACCSR